MALNRQIKKLPGVLQTEVQQEFYAATFDQVFSSANVEAAQGFIGRRSSDVLDPLVDVYLGEPTKERAAYQLEPIAYDVNSALQDSNHMFYEDFVNYCISYNLPVWTKDKVGKRLRDKFDYIHKTRISKFRHNKN